MKKISFRRMEGNVVDIFKRLNHYSYYRRLITKNPPKNSLLPNFYLWMVNIAGELKIYLWMVNIAGELKILTDFFRRVQRDDREPLQTEYNSYKVSHRYL